MRRGRRRVRLLTSGGQEFVEASRRQRSRVGTYWNAIHHFLATGDSRSLNEFIGETVGGHELLTDLDLIEMYARRGQLDFESIYRKVR